MAEGTRAEGTRKPWERTLQEAGARMEEEVKRIVTYLNDEVVPDVRRHGSEALRTAAGELNRLAAQMDDRARGTTGRSDRPADSSAHPTDTTPR